MAAVQDSASESNIATSGPTASSTGWTESPPSSRPVRVAVVTPIPTPYRDPFWSEFARTPGIDLTVFYCSGGKSDRPWTAQWKQEFRSEVLAGWNLLRWRGVDASCFWNEAIARRLAEGQFDAILVGGYNHLTMWRTILFAVRRRIPYFLMCESHQRTIRSAWKQWLKRPILRWLVAHAAGCLPTGQLASEFLLSYGANQDKLTLLPNVPDVVAIESKVKEIRERGEHPGPSWLRSRPVILFVGRLIEKKRAELVIRAFHRIGGDEHSALVIVGDGPLRPELEGLVQELGIRENVWFAGFVQPAEVLRWFAFARVFVLPSSETWGVAVLESVAAGVPVIVSDEVGCHADVVTDAVLGKVVPARDELALSNAMKVYLSQQPTDVANQQSRQLFNSRMRYDVLAQSLRNALMLRFSESKSSTVQAALS